jgi:hypothetical protein
VLVSKRLKAVGTIALLCAGLGVPAYAQGGALAAEQAQALVGRALATELNSAQDHSHPMRYRLRKTSPRLTSTKEIAETGDGDVARLVAINDQPLSPASEQQERARLDALTADPSRQRHRKQSEDSDSALVLKLLRMLPTAFVYEYAGVTGNGAERFTFKPNPAFSPPDMESQALTSMTGELWIDPKAERVTRLEGHLQADTDYGWGVLGKLDKGGWVVIDQADVGGNQWRIVRFQMKMTLRILFRTRVSDATEEMTRYTPLPRMDYRQAIRLLRAGEVGGQ